MIEISRLVRNRGIEVHPHFLIAARFLILHQHAIPLDCSLRAPLVPHVESQTSAAVWIRDLYYRILRAIHDRTAEKTVPLTCIVVAGIRQGIEAVGILQVVIDPQYLRSNAMVVTRPSVPDDKLDPIPILRRVIALLIIRDLDATVQRE